MKNYIIIFLTISMLVKPFWPIVEYVVNYDYIVNVLCENKDKPELHCNGKCYLMTKLAEESEQGSQNPFDKKKSNIEIQYLVFCESMSNFKFETEFFESNTDNFKGIKVLNSNLYSIDISDPPELA